MRNGRGTFLALDWAKAFDSICPEAMTRALLRFGCPPKMVNMATEIYKQRKMGIRQQRETSIMEFARVARFHHFCLRL